MKIYTAGNVGIISREIVLNKLYKSRLLSYYEISRRLFATAQSFQLIIMERTKKKVDLFIDSGAFSAWSQGVTIDIQEYIAFIKEYKDVISVYANLDVIGDPRATWKNQKIMERAGLSPLPVFHYGEDQIWLKRYLAEGYSYIALGGMVPINNENLSIWLDQLFEDYLTDSDGMPIIKVHGFGLTSLVLMLRYPWFSVDSTSWIVTGRMGSIYIPYKKNGKWVYDQNSLKIAVSNRSPNKKEAGKHIDTMTVSEKKLLIDYISEKGYVLGKSEFRYEEQSYQLMENERWASKKPENKKQEREIETILEIGLSNTYQLRDEINIQYFLDLEKSMPRWPWPFKHQSTKKLF